MLGLLLVAAMEPHPFQAWVERTEAEMWMAFNRQKWIAEGVMEETEHYFQWPWAVEEDVAVMEWRVENTPADAPSADAVHHLPGTYAWRHYRDAQLYIDFLDEEVRPWLLPGWEHWVVDAIIEDTKGRLKVWRAVYDCTGHYVGMEGRRWHLNELLKMVGPEMFYRGGWPDPVPPHAYGWRKK